MPKFQKGKSGNYKGRTPMPKEYREFKKLTVMQYKEKIEKYFAMTQDEIKDILQNHFKDISVLDIWLLKSIHNGIIYGDYSTLDRMLSRVIGMPSQKLTLSGALNMQPADIKKIQRWRQETIKK